MRALLVTALALFAVPAFAAESKPFEEWLSELRAEAEQRGFSKDTLATLDGLQPLPDVIEKDRSQPESKMTFARYREIVLTEWRIREGQRLYREHLPLLEQVGAKYGVHPEFIVALWGVESKFGSIMGSHSIVNALATLAHDGRRSAFFRKELFSALTILDQGHIAPADMKGSWAGAMGQCQFMPSTFLRHAADFDGDGKKDIWGNRGDVFASAGNYLSKIGWDPKAPWGQEVQLPKSLPAGVWDKKLSRSLSAWRKLGVKTAAGEPLPNEGDGRKATLLRPDDASPAYLVHANYHALLQWNRSKYFATAVSLLADEIRKGPPPDATSGLLGTPDAGTP